MTVVSAVWVDDRLVPVEQARVSVLDHGFTVGDGVFETLKVQGGAPFALSRHLRRLRSSAALLGLDHPPDDRIRSAVDTVLRAASDELGPQGRLRITVTGAPGALGSDRGDGPSTLVVTAASAAPWPASSAVVTVPWTRNPRSPVAGAKTTSYAENVVALAYARSRDAGEAVFADTDGRLSEGTGSNIVVVVDGQALTPALSTGCLPGITRELLLEWCDVQEAELPVEVLRSADEVMLTSSTRDVHPVHAVDGRPLSAPGRLTARLRAQFSAHAARTSDP